MNIYGLNIKVNDQYKSQHIELGFSYREIMNEDHITKIFKYYLIVINV